MQGARGKHIVLTAYRPKQARGNRERELEALDAAILDRSPAASKATAQFENHMKKPGQEARIHERFAEERWHPAG
jgi:hypothetical protein